MNKVCLLFVLALFCFSASGSAVEFPSPVVSYTMEVSLDPQEKTIKGTEIVVWNNTGSTATDELFFHLYLNAFKNSHSTFIREAEKSRGELSEYFKSITNDGWGYCEVLSVTATMPGTSNEVQLTPFFVQPDDDNTDDETVFKLDLPRPVAPGKSVTLTIEFIAKLPHKAPRTGYHRDYFFAGQWFPKIGVWMEGEWNCHQFHANTEFFADYGDYDVSITLPREYVVGASGVLTDSTGNGDLKTLRFQQNCIHDFAWTAYPGYKTASRTFEYPDLPSVQMRLLYQPEHEKYVDIFFDATANTLKHYGLWYVAYPYSQITIIDAGWRSHSCGMEYPALFTTCIDWLTSQGEQSPRGLTVHECGHQFFYGIIGSNEFENAWMDEGLNTYATSRCMDAAYGPGAFAKTYLARTGFGIPMTFSRAPLDQRSWSVAAHRRNGWRDFMDKFSWDFVDYTSYRNNAYDKPALMMWTLEYLLGESTFNKIMKNYAQRFVFKHPKPQDFINVVNEFAPQNMDWFFEKMLHQPGVVDYAVTKVESNEQGSKMGYFGRGADIHPVETEEDDETLYLSQVHVRRLGAISLPVELLVTFENGDKTELEWDGKAPYKIFYVKNRSKLEKALVDPYHKIWLDVDYSNNGKYRQKSSFASYRWGAAWLFWLQHLLETVAVFS